MFSILYDVILFIHANFSYYCQIIILSNSKITLLYKIFPYIFTLKMSIEICWFLSIFVFLSLLTKTSVSCLFM